MLTENQVIDYVAKELNSRGYENIKKNYTSRKGYDIEAEKNGEKLYVEAKGQTSSKQGTNREGKEFTHAQKKTHVAMAIYKTMQTLEKEKNCEVGIALPDDKAHVGIIDRIAPSLNKINIRIYFVNQGGKVR